MWTVGLALDTHRSRIGQMRTAQRLQKCALACTILADQRKDPATLGDDINTIQSCSCPKVFADTADFQQGRI